MEDELTGLKKFLEKYASLAENRMKSVDIAGDEFQDIRNISVEYKKKYQSSEGAKEINRKKNRYKDILPYDYSRVKLPIAPNDSSDYINANFIKDHHNQICYIASQGPMPATVGDFWRMSWAFNVRLLIMACKQIELGKPRCQRYWPQENGYSEQFGNITVDLIKQTNISNNMVQRDLTVKHKQEQRKITQLHYTDWPDHGAPETSETILHLVKIARKLQPGNEPPILVHCSAGCGRTGAIIAIDYARKMIEERVKNLDVIQIVKHLRQQRPSMVQTKEQYDFLYEVIREMVTKELNKYDKEFNSSANADSTYENIALLVKGKTPSSSKTSASRQTVSLNVMSRPRSIDGMPCADTIPKITTTLTTGNSAVKKHIILPSEHAVNVSSNFRRSRSQHNKSIPSDLQRPPLPRKVSEQFFSPFGPELPPKSPGIKKHEQSIDSSNTEKNGNKQPALPVKPPVTGSRLMEYENVYPPALQQQQKQQQFHQQKQQQISHSAQPQGAAGRKKVVEYEVVDIQPNSPIANEEFIPVAKPAQAVFKYPMQTQTSNVSMPVRKTLSNENKQNMPRELPDQQLHHKALQPRNSNELVTQKPPLYSSIDYGKRQMNVSASQMKSQTDSNYSRLFSLDKLPGTISTSSSNHQMASTYASLDSNMKSNRTQSLGRNEIPTYTAVEKSFRNDKRNGFINTSDSKEAWITDLPRSKSEHQWSISVESAPPSLPARTPESQVILGENGQMMPLKSGQDYTGIDSIERSQSSHTVASHGKTFESHRIIDENGKPLPYTTTRASSHEYTPIDRIERLTSSESHRHSTGSVQFPHSKSNQNIVASAAEGLTRIFQKGLHKSSETQVTQATQASLLDYENLGFNKRLNIKPAGPRELPTKLR